MVSQLKRSLALAIAIGGLNTTAFAQDDQQSSTPEEPFDFKGAKLGMSEAEFLNWNAPIAPKLNQIKGEGAEQLRLMCDGDPLPKGMAREVYVRRSVAEKLAGVRACKIGQFGKLGSIWAFWPADLKIGSYQSSDFAFRFYKGKLYEIEFGDRIEFLDSVKAGLEAKFGKPTRVWSDETTLKNRSVVLQARAAWERPDSVIYLRAPDEDFEHMNLLYATPSVYDEVRRFEPPKPNPADTM